MYTIQHVAKAARVSQATVSRVINGYPAVKVETAQRVRRAMARLGYVPPPLEHRRGPRPRSAAGIRTGIITFLEMNTVFAYHVNELAMLLKGIEGAITESNLIFCFACQKPDGSLPHVLASNQSDGILLHGGNPSERVAEVIRKIPSVWLSSWKDGDGKHILVGNEAVGRLAADFLLSRGHRSLAFLNVNPHNPALQARGEAFNYQVFRSGVESVVLQTEGAHVETSFEIPVLESRTVELVKQFSKMPKRPTGLFVPSDLMTAVAYHALYQHGLVPGRDVDIISSNHELNCLAGLTPRPATIDIGWEPMGRRAVDQLLWQMRNPKEQNRMQVVIEPALVPGETTWPQPA